MQASTVKVYEKPLDEKLKSIPPEQQYYIKGLIDGILLATTTKTNKTNKTKTIGGQAV